MWKKQSSWRGYVISASLIATHAGADEPKDTANTLEEVVVTAQKRVEDLQVVPISLQVVSSKALTEQNHNSLEELSEVVPAVHIENASGFTNDMFIRGVGSGGNQGFDQSVGVFVDDIYHGRSRMTGATFLDLERVEVLKGPQSTFFGNNAIAGALNIVSKKPTDSFDVWVRALYGQFGQYAVEGAVGLPISDKFSARLALTDNGQDGWIKNINTDQWAPHENNKAGRLTLLYRPTDDLDVLMKVEGSNNKTTGSADQWDQCPPAAPIPANDRTAGAGGAVCADALALGVPVGLDSNRTSALAGTERTLSDLEGVLTVDYRAWGHTFTSVSGFYHYNYAQHGNVALVPVETIIASNPEHYHQFSQELRVASPTGQPIEYQAGLYFQTDNLVSGANYDVPFLSPLVPIVAPDLVSFTPLALVSNFEQTEHVYSAFGSVKWNVTNSLKFNAGLRSSWVKKNDNGNNTYGTAGPAFSSFTPLPADLQNAFPFLSPPGTQTGLRLSENSLMPSAGIQYQLVPNMMAYFTYNRGFLAGGFNAQNLLDTPEFIEYGPEHVNAYELGLKSTWLDQTLLLNVDLFRGNYTGLQVGTYVVDPSTQIGSLQVRNAASSISQGVELEMRWVISSEVRVSADITYLDSYYDSFKNGQPTTLQKYCTGLDLTQYTATPQCANFPFPVQANTFDRTGQQTSFAPRWSGSVTASYNTRLSHGYIFTTEFSPYFTSHYWSTDIPQDDFFSPYGSYVRLDARLGLESEDGRWQVALIGKNLTDRIIARQDFISTKSQPRNVAGQVLFKW